jgi:hypothetical protein
MPIPFIFHERAEPQTLDEVRDWYRDIVDALNDQIASIRQAIGGGSTVALRYMGMPEADLDAYQDARRQELEGLLRRGSIQRSRKYLIQRVRTFPRKRRFS